MEDQNSKKIIPSPLERARERVKIHSYDRSLIKYARENRKKQTLGELKLWAKLRAKRFMNLKFKRQQSICNYIVDFYCRSKSIVIEIDGFSHDEQKYQYDLKREQELIAKDLKVVRFTEHEVASNIDSVLEALTLILSQGEENAKL